jgi:hypothetical protein
MPLYRAICAWLEASAAAMSQPEEFGPEGDGPAQAEYAHSYTSTPELHSGYSSQSIDDDDDARHKPRPIGFTRNPPR